MRDPGSEALSLDADSPAATRRIAASLAPLLAPGDVLALDGELGAGKTLLAAALCEALGVPPGAVDSPTFVLLNEYEGAPFPLYHFDAYRLEADAETLAEAGFLDERLGDGVCIVEWAERVAAYLPAGALRLRIVITGAETRRLDFAGWPPARLAGLESA